MASFNRYEFEKWVKDEIGAGLPQYDVEGEYEREVASYFDHLQPFDCAAYLGEYLTRAEQVAVPPRHDDQVDAISTQKPARSFIGKKD